MPLTLIEGPDDEPLEVWEAKHHITQAKEIEVDETYLDQQVIPAARQRCEGATWRQLMTATWEEWRSGFPCDGAPMELPRPPLQSVTHIKYVDSSGVLQTWASSNYLVIAPAGPKCQRGRIEQAYGVSWPTVRCQMDAVQIRFVAGYGNRGADVPPLLKMAMLQDVGSLFAHREEIVIDPASEVVLQLPNGAASIYRGFKSRPRFPWTE